MEELALYINSKATEYWNETGLVKIDRMPSSVVDFVIETFFNVCNFPSSYSDNAKAKRLYNFKNAMAMACVDIYAKAGNEGQTVSIESDEHRTYETSWITPRLFNGLPNFAKAPF